MNDNMNHASPELKPTDVDWLAFQYLAGELPAADVVRLEARLASEQPAREALARVVALTQAVALVESTTQQVAFPVASLVTPSDLTPSDLTPSDLVPSNRKNHAWMAPSAWLASAVLACVACLLIWNPRALWRDSSPVNQPLTVNDVASEDSAELAAFWVGTEEFLASTELLGNGDWDSTLFDDDLLESVSGAAVAVETDLDRLRAPSWMMAALADTSAVEGQE